MPLLHRQQPLIQSHPLPYKQKRHQVLEHQNHYTDTYSEANRSKRFSLTVRLVSSLTSRISASPIVSPISQKPPGRSNVPRPGSNFLRVTSSSPCSFRINAATAELGFKKYSKPQLSQRLLFHSVQQSVYFHIRGNTEIYLIRAS